MRLKQSPYLYNSMKSRQHDNKQSSYQLIATSRRCNRATGESISHWSHQSRKIRLIRFSSQDSFVRQCGVVRASAFLLRTAKLRDMDTFSVRNSGQNTKYVTEDMMIESNVRRFLSMHLLENSSVRESNPTQPTNRRRQ
jgi:hypothetical protein